MHRFLLSAAAAAALIPAAAQAASTTYYFSCVGPTKVQNAEVADWSTTAPATSYTAGGGCGTADPGIFTENPFGDVSADFLAGGKHTGPIQSLTVNIDSLLLSQARVPEDIGAEATLVVDGKDVLGGVAAFRPKPVVSATGLTERFTFTFGRSPEFVVDENGDPVLDEDGNEVVIPAAPLVPADGEHTVAIRFSSAFIDYNNVWVWGATEIPGHVVVNPDAPAGVLVEPAS